jgi:hypothetical protein
MNLDSKVIEHIAAKEAGFIIMPSDLIKEFELTGEQSLQHLTIAMKAGFVELRFKLFDQPWVTNLNDIPMIVETKDGPHTVTPRDVLVGFERTTVQ